MMKVKLGDFGGSFRRLSKRSLFPDKNQNKDGKGVGGEGATTKPTKIIDGVVIAETQQKLAHLSDQTFESSDSSPVHIFAFRSSRSILKNGNDNNNNSLSSSRKQLSKALEVATPDKDGKDCNTRSAPVDPPGFTSPLSVGNGEKDNSSEEKSTLLVRFDLEMTEFYSNGRDMQSMREWNRCWYNENTLKSFKMDASKTADKVLVGKQAGWRPRSTSQTMAKRSAAEQLRLVLMQVFEECRNIKSEEDMEEALHQALTRDNSKNLRTRLCEMYQQSDELVGLEVFVLSGLRGDASNLCRRVLSFVDEKVKNKGKTSKKNSLYARTSQTVSRASRLYVRELAMAQAAALSAS